MVDLLGCSSAEVFHPGFVVDHDVGVIITQSFQDITQKIVGIAVTSWALWSAHGDQVEITGFLQAGVPGVVSTLWPVTDVSTALLLARFYRYHLRDQHDPASALHLAQEWLRNATARDLGLADLYQRQYEASGSKDAAAFRAMRYHRSTPNDKPFAHRYYWAAFVFTGVTGPLRW